MLKGRVAQAKAERTAHRDTVPVIVTVADLGALGEDFDRAFGVGVVTGYVLIAKRPCLCQLAGGILLAEKQLRYGSTAVLTGQIHIKDGADLIVKREFYRGTSEQHDYDLLTAFAELVDRGELFIGQSHMLPVVTLGLIVIRKSGECEHDVAFFKRNALDASLIKGVLGRGERGRIDQRTACALIAHILEQLAGDVQLLFAA